MFDDEYFPEDFEDRIEAIESKETRELFRMLYVRCSRSEDRISQILELIPMKYKKGPFDKSGRLFFGSKNIQPNAEDFEKAKERMRELLEQHTTRKPT